MTDVGPLRSSGCCFVRLGTRRWERMKKCPCSLVPADLIPTSTTDDPSSLFSPSSDMTQQAAYAFFYEPHRKSLAICKYDSGISCTWSHDCFPCVLLSFTLIRVVTNQYVHDDLLCFFSWCPTHHSRLQTTQGTSAAVLMSPRATGNHSSI